jgi:hypothetical protein
MRGEILTEWKPLGHLVLPGRLKTLGDHAIRWRESNSMRELLVIVDLHKIMEVRYA